MNGRGARPGAAPPERRSREPPERPRGGAAEAAGAKMIIKNDHDEGNDGWQ